jgi:ubiquinone/menaquinone biosynthesis C-methylase UbiE
MLPQLRKWIQPSPEIRLLDVGGGTGAVTALYAAECGEVVIVEPAQARVAHGRPRRPGIRFQIGRAESLPFPDADFDRVVAMLSMHHTADPEAAFAEMFRVLRPGGRLVVQEVSPDSKKGKRLIRWAPAAHAATLLTPEDMTRKLEAAGFASITSEPAMAGLPGYLVIAVRPAIGES